MWGNGRRIIPKSRRWSEINAYYMQVAERLSNCKASKALDATVKYFWDKMNEVLRRYQFPDVTKADKPPSA